MVATGQHGRRGPVRLVPVAQRILRIRPPAAPPALRTLPAAPPALRALPVYGAASERDRVRLARAWAAREADPGAWRRTLAQMMARSTGGVPDAP